MKTSARSDGLATDAEGVTDPDLELAATTAVPGRRHHQCRVHDIAEPGDDGDSLLARADAAMYARRRHVRS